MTQVTYHITDFCTERFTEILSEVAGTPDYINAGQVLAVMFEQCWDTEKIQAKASLLHEMLPKAEIVGVNHHDDMYSSLEEHENTLITFIMFEKHAFSLFRMPLTGLTDEQAGRMLGEKLSAVKGLKGVWMFISEFMRSIENILGEADRNIRDIPIFGSTSARSIVFNGTSMGYLFDENGCRDDTVVTVLFTGEDISLDVSYNYGWTPVGKQMKITGTDGDFRITSIDGAPAADIFCRYLGIDRDAINIPNICEFPLIVEQDGINVGRSPYGSTPEGALEFGAAVGNCRSIRFSYGAQTILLSETYDDSVSLGRFSPQAVVLIVCMNRQIFLKDEEEKEIGYYRRICPRDLPVRRERRRTARCAYLGGHTRGREGQVDTAMQCSALQPKEG